MCQTAFLRAPLSPIAWYARWPSGVGRSAGRAYRRGLKRGRREGRRHGRPGHGAARARPWYRRRPAFLAPNSRDLYGPPRPPHWDLSVVFLSGHLAVCQKGFILRGSHGPLAQLVEQLTLNQVVPGSSPGRPTNKPPVYQYVIRTPLRNTSHYIDFLLQIFST